MEMSSSPDHPLVIDRKTGRARLATQDDVHLLEAIRISYEAILRDFEEKLRMGRHYQEQLNKTYNLSEG